jgi:hypothetical protein
MQQIKIASVKKNGLKLIESGKLSNRTFQKMLSSRQLSKNLKFKIYKSKVFPEFC